MLDRFDELVDDVAKSMTAAPPDASLAHRVSTRIAEAAGDDGRRPVWTRPWVLVPVASVCVLIVAVVVTREGSVRLKPDATPVTPPSIIAPVGSPGLVERPFQGRGDRGPENLARGPERPALRSQAVAPLPPLATPTIEPIDVDRLDVQPLVEMDEIQIGPIALDRIEIAAMP